jgi:hypothetical protein
MRKVCRFLLLVPLLAAHDGALAQTSQPQQGPPVNVQFDFQQGQLEISPYVAEDQQTYSRLVYQGLDNVIINPGSPSLPVKYVRLIVPRDKNYSDISVVTTPPEISELQHLVYPVQNPVPTADEAVNVPFAPPNPEIYQVEAPYPSSPVKYVGEGYYDGDKHIITLAVYPAQYEPSTGRIFFYSSISVTVNENMQQQPAMHSITRAPVGLQSLYNQPLHGLVANEQDIPVFTGGPLTPTAGAGGKSKFYEYVVITSPELRPAFEELVGWKRRKGLNAGIVEIQDILTDPAYNAGDVISGINDDAGKLRAYLHEAYLNGTVYAVLGGDPSIIPIRYAAGSIDAGNTPDNMIPSDLYYTDFNGDWDVDGDIYYGEESFSGQDAVDYQPEIFVGRMLVKTEAQAVNHVHKVIRYDRNPGRGDNSYVTRAFFTQADQLLDWGNEAWQVANELTFFPAGNINVWNETPNGIAVNYSGPNASSVVSEITYNYGLVSLQGHGSPNNIAVGTTEYNGCGPDNLRKQKVTFLDAVDGWCAPTQPGNGLDNLDDFDHLDHPYQDFPHIFYTVACETIPYDDWLRAPGDADMGIVYTSYMKAGAAAYFGNTRYGWVGTSSDMYAEFARKIVQGNYHIGIAEGLSKAAFFSGWGWCEKTNSLIGCPEMEIWTDKPNEFKDATVSGTAGTITVNTGGVTDATITVISALDNGHTYYQQSIGATSNTFFGVPNDYAVTITKHDYLPFLWQKNVIVQNHDFYGTAYVGSPNDISSGQAVDRTQPAGPVTVKSGGNVYFHADGKGTILLDRGFEVEPNAAFEAK